MIAIGVPSQPQRADHNDDAPLDEFMEPVATTVLPPPTAPIPALRVLCVDDNPLVIEALALKLSLLVGFVWLKPLSDAGQLLAEVRRQRPDVVLLDIDMPGRDSLDALKELIAHEPRTKVLMFSGLTRGDLVDRAFDAGAWGFLSKHADVESIVAAIRRVAAGEFLLAEEFGIVAPEVLFRPGTDTDAS